jgi:hypothetical protein
VIESSDESDDDRKKREADDDDLYQLEDSDNENSPGKPARNAKSHAQAKAPRKQKQGASLDAVSDKPQPKMMSRFLPSTKMKWAMDQLREWQQTHPDDKVRTKPFP